MTASETPRNPTMTKLADTDQTVANPDEDVRGRSITGIDGEDLGKVKDLLVDSEGRVRLLLAEHGGILGIGATESFIPVDAITAITADEVRVDTDRGRIAGAPRYDPELSDDHSFYERVYGYYGISPFWGPGYTSPGFPYFRSPTGR